MGDVSTELPIDREARAGRIGAALRACRLASGLSQRALAERVHCDPTYISHIERGFREPSVEMLVLMGAVVGLRVRLGPHTTGGE